MNKLLTVLVTAFLATSALAASHAGAPMTSAANPKPLEAMKAGSDKAQAKAEIEKAKKAKTGRKNSTDDQMKKDAAKL